MPYRLLDTSEHRLLISKNKRVEKVSPRNVKAFIPRKDSFDINNEKNRLYNLRKRKILLIILRVQLVRVNFMVKSSKIKFLGSFQINMSLSGFNHLKVRFLKKCAEKN